MLTFIVALHCEAKPLIDLYKLKKVVDKPFDLYRRDGDQTNPGVELLITGIGALSVSSAVGWLAGRNSDDSQRVWLNIGTSGHMNHAIGTIILVHGVGDEVLQKSHYPPLVAKWPGLTDAVLTVTAPCSDYPGGAAVDMEAYAFFITANRFSDSEIVQSLKVISDNEEYGIEHLNASKLTELVQNKIADIDAYAQALLNIRPDEFEYDISAIQQMRGTHSQRRQAGELLKKLSALNASQEMTELEASLADCSHLKEVLPILNQAVDSVVPSLGGDNG